MNLTGWNQRYLSSERGDQGAIFAPPTALVVRTAESLKPGRALDLACGTGRNAFWLAEQGWNVTAVDGATAAIELLRDEAVRRNLRVDAVAADLSLGQFAIAPESWDLITICYYLQRDLLAPAFSGLRRGGVLLAITHIAESGEEPHPHRLEAGELLSLFKGGNVLHYREGKPDDQAHKRAVAEIVIQR